ncbi:branched-chain amino acid ABC transporter permease [Agromyces bauzanensis]
MILTLGLSPYWQGVAVVAGIAALAALGLQLTISSGQFSLVHGALAGAASYVAAIASVQFGLGLWAAVLAGCLTGALMGGVISAVLLRLDGVLFGLATLAIGQALTLLAANSTYLGGTTGYNGVPLRTELWHVVLCLAAGVAVLLLLRTSRVGLGIVAVGRDPVVAQSVGLPVRRIKIASFAVGGALAGVAGALNVQYVSFVDPTALNFATEVQLLLFVVIGGMTTPIGALVGAFGITLASELLRFAELDRAWIFGLLLMVVALLRPQGLLNRRSVGMPRQMRKQRQYDAH